MKTKSNAAAGLTGVQKPTPLRSVLFKKEITPDQLSRKFSANLKLLREARDLNKSDLAKEIWGTEVDARGYTVAKNRDRIGAWEAEKSQPTPENLALLAHFFGVEPAALAPDLVARSASGAPEAMSLRILESDPTRAHVQINTLLPTSVAVEVMQLVTRAQLTSEQDAGH